MRARLPVAAAARAIGRVCAPRAPHASASGRPALLTRFSSSTQAAGKNGAEPGVSPTLKLIGAYVGVSLAAMAAIARYKDRDAAEEESVRVFNMAKRAVVKDRRFFEAIGYPKEFELLQSEQPSHEDGEGGDASEGVFRVIGDKGTAVVTFKQGPVPAAADQSEEEASSSAADASKSELVTFDVLRVRLEDGSEFSALDSYLKNAAVASQQKSEALGKKLVVPAVGGVVIGGLAAFFLIRILRNRASYVHKLALDRVNDSAAARALLGHPIKSNRKDYVGSLTQQAANYTISCRGPQGEGTLIVKAFKDEADAAREEGADGPVLTTPGTAWKFSTLMLAVKRSSSQRAKNAKTIDLLASGNATTTTPLSGAGGSSSK